MEDLQKDYLSDREIEDLANYIAVIERGEAKRLAKKSVKASPPSGSGVRYPRGGTG